MQTLKIDDELHRRFKYMCVLRGITMFEATEEAMVKWLDQSEWLEEHAQYVRDDSGVMNELP